MIRYLLSIGFLCSCLVAGAADSLVLQSPSGNLQAVITLVKGQLTYRLNAGKQVLIHPSRLGLSMDDHILGAQVHNLRFARQYVIREKVPARLNNQITLHHCKGYVVALEQEQHTDTLECRLFDNGFAFRYLPAVKAPKQVKEELTTFQLPATAGVWYFERNSNWKLKSYAGLWMRTTVEKLPKVSSQGPIQGKPLVIELPSNQYLVLTEAALYDYSGMRLKAIGNNSVQVNFTEDNAGFAVRGKLQTPWRVVLLGKDRNALVNNAVIEHLNPAPDPQLFPDTRYIKPGKSVWSWISRNERYMQPAEERKFIDAAAALNFQYTLLDEGWETQWPRKWEQLQKICAYGARKQVQVWVWKHSKDIMDTVLRNRFLDSVRLAGAVGIKTDFMNSEARDLVDFEIGLLQAAAARQLMVNFHGCHAPTGESKTYPNEMTREGIRGMELNIMNEPIPAWHNAALPFTRLLCGHGDYTPAYFTKKANTTYAHQLALLYLFNSPFQCIAENPVVLVSDPLFKPILPLLRTLPVVWDETLVLPGSSIGKVAAMARRKGKDWYVAVINGTDSAREFILRPNFLNRKARYRATFIADKSDGAGFLATEENIPYSIKRIVTLPPTGGWVIEFKCEN